MKKQNLILSAALVAIFSASTAFAEAEVTGKIVHESGFYSNAGSTIGDRGNATITGTGLSSTPISAMGTATGMYRGVTTATTPAHAKRDAFKQETTAKIYIDGELNEVTDGATYHVELNLMTDGKGGTNYDSNESYTQRDALREAYVDTTVDDWSIRAGKQQVVWGTADGMKLLDAINPTDYAEMAQNQMEDSRLPVWMVNAETTQEDGSELQVVVSQAKENVFAGLNRNIATGDRFNSNMSLDDGTLNNGTDTGHAFMMMGPDTITGVYNGFLNITPDLGSVATRFAGAFKGDSAAGAANSADDLQMTDVAAGTYTLGATSANPSDDTVNAFNGMFAGSVQNLGGAGGAANGMNKFTVGGFKIMAMGNMSDALNPGGSSGNTNDATLAYIPAGFKKAILDTWQGLIAPTANGGYGSAAAAQTALGMTCAAANCLTGNHMLALGFQPLYNTNLNNLTTADDSAFDYMGSTTFKTFDAFVNAGSEYVYNMPENKDLDVAFRFKDSTTDGLNYSLNTSYNYDKNPIIDLSWRGTDGAELTTRQTYHSMATQGGEVTKAAYDSLAANMRSTTLQLYDASNANAASAITAAGDASVNATAANGFYGGQAQAAAYTAAYNAAGTADAAAQGAGYVAAQAHRAKLRFSQEVKRVKQIGGSFDMAIETAALGPVVIRGEALYTKDGYSPVINKDKLAIGDLVGALQMVKGDRAKIVLGADITAMTNMMISAQFIQDSNLDFVDNGNNYTADYATMHLSNGFNKAIKDKNFYSLFFSKPFGASGEHRWNNITMLEEGVGGNGKWNRLDAEFSIDDDTQATVEYNKYWGNPNTQFGQLEKSSNIQVGVKYSF
ncbi:hypothetical protein OAS51_01170 [Candidatus Thioglobus sp.]|nr:hypothetical protein [Candidatus Thioglobus sp.]